MSSYQIWYNFTEDIQNASILVSAIDYMVYNNMGKNLIAHLEV